MTIENIPRSVFEELLPPNPVVEKWMVNQVEWFSNSSGSLLGAIAKGQVLAGWNYIILERDPLGDFHVQQVMNSFLNSEAARVDLLLWMAGSEKIARIDLLLAGIERNDRANLRTTDSWLSPVPVEISGERQT